MNVPRRSLRWRFLVPVGLLAGAWLTAEVLLALLVGRPALLGVAYLPLLNALALVRIVTLLFGALFIYPPMFMRGASLRERVLGAYVVPCLHLLQSIGAATAFFSLGEAVYYGFNSLTFGIFFLQLGNMGVADLGVRLWLRRRHAVDGKIFHWTQPTGVLLAGVALFVALFWEGGVHWFYIYQEGYKLLFQ